MKTKALFYLILIVLLFINNLAAQGLLVTYEEKINPPKIDLSSIGDPNIRSMIEKQASKSVITTKELLVNKGLSLYVSAKEIEKEENLSENNSNVKINFSRSIGAEIVYKDQSKLEMIKQANFLGRDFLINSPLKPTNWNITNNKKIIAGYNCIEATISNDSTKTTAWYCPDIPVNNGPGIYWGLPGLIMSVESNKGMQIITCTSVATLTEEPKIEAPKKGKKVSDDEFKKMVEEKKKQLNPSGQSGAKVEFIKM